MNVWTLAIPLTGLFTCTNLCASATACCPRFVLNTSPNGQSLFTGDRSFALVVLAHGSGFPLTDTASHELWAVGFANITAFDEDVEHSHVPSVVVQVKLATPQS